MVRIQRRWSSNDSTSRHSPHNSRMMRMCRAVAIVAAGAATVTTSAVAAVSPAQAAVDNPQICYVDVTFDTGSDDLRSNTGLVLWLKYDNGFWYPSNEIRGGASANSTNKTFNNVPFYGRCLDQRKVKGYRLQLISHSDPFQGPDQWRVKRVHIKDGETTEVFTNQWQGVGAKLITDSNTLPGTLYQTCDRAWDVSGHASDRLDQTFCP